MTKNDIKKITTEIIDDFRKNLAKQQDEKLQQYKRYLTIPDLDEKPQQIKRYLTIPDLSEYLNLSKDTLYKNHVKHFSKARVIPFEGCKKILFDKTIIDQLIYKNSNIKSRRPL